MRPTSHGSQYSIADPSFSCDFDLHAGTLTNVRIVDGVEVIDVIEAGYGFLEGSPDEPHYVMNRGDVPSVSVVTFASVVGMPNLIPIKD